MKTKKKLGIIVNIMFFGVVGLFFYWYLQGVDWNEITTISIDLVPFGLSLLLFIGIRFIFPIVWIFLLKEFGQRIRNTAGLLYAYSKAWIGRYVPGKIVSFTGKVYFVSQKGYDKKTLVIVSILESFIQVTVGIIFGILFVGVAGREVLDRNLSIFAFSCGILLMILLSPPVFNLLIQKVYWIYKKRKLENKYRFKFGTLAKVIAMNVLLNIVTGIGVTLIFCSVDPGFDIMGNLLYVTGAVSLAGSIGVLVLVAPSGFGVREGVLTILLLPLFSKEVLLVLLVLVRVSGMVADALFFVLSWLGTVVPAMRTGRSSETASV